MSEKDRGFLGDIGDAFEGLGDFVPDVSNTVEKEASEWSKKPGKKIVEAGVLGTIGYGIGKLF